MIKPTLLVQLCAAFPKWSKKSDIAPRLCLEIHQSKAIGIQHDEFPLCQFTRLRLRQRHQSSEVNKSVKGQATCVLNASNASCRSLRLLPKAE